NPLAGAGAGASEDLLVTTSNRLGRPGYLGSTVGGEYTRLLGDTGLVGLTLYSLALGSYGVALWRTYQRSSPTPAKKYALLGLLWLVYYLGFSFAYNPVDYWTIPFLVFSIIGIALAAAEREQAAQTRERSRFS
ncbi:MAG: hypothetical protein ACE5JL_03610, partial [Dehalococcoidia bacterium]